MPIKKENIKRYPKDWKIRSRFVRTYRAKNRCEWCGVPNYAVGWRDDNGVFHGVCGTVFHDMAGQGLFYPSLERLDYKTARFIADEFNADEWNEERYIVIVLTVAHVHDHRPEAANLLNLAALCQRCHNKHDQKMRISNARKRKLSKQEVLFL